MRYVFKQPTENRSFYEYFGVNKLDLLAQNCRNTVESKVGKNE